MNLKLTLSLLLFTIITTRAPAQNEPKNWREPTKPIHIAGPIYYAGSEGLGVYLIKSKAGLILLSGVMPGSAPLIIDSIAALGFNPKDVRLLLIPHAHIDHVGSLAEVKRRTQARVAVMEADVALLASGGRTDYLYAERPEMHFEGVKADKILKDGDTVALGSVKMTAHLTPGHTRGSTTWEMNIEDSGKRYKVVFADGTGINRGTFFGKVPSYPGIVNDYKRTFTLLAALSPDIFLSYHVEAFDFANKRKRMAKEGPKAWVDPEGYAAWVKAQKAAFEKELTAIRE